MQEKLSEIKSTVLPAVENAKTLAELDAVRVGVVGKNGSLTAITVRPHRLCANTTRSRSAMH